jgi:hypothetical protein
MNGLRALLGRMFSPAAIASDPEAQRQHSFIRMPAPLRDCARGTVASLSFTIPPTPPAVDQYFRVLQPTLELRTVRACNSDIPPDDEGQTQLSTSERGSTGPENRSATDKVWAYRRRLYATGIVIALTCATFVTALHS